VGQEVFRAVARKINAFRRDQPSDSFRGWLRTITRRKILDFFRRRSKEAVAAGGTDALNDMNSIPAASDSPTNDDVNESDSISSAVDRQERSILIRRAVELIHSSFEDRTCRAFWNVAVEGHSPKDVAADLRMSLNAVYMAKSKVLRRLRDEFGEIVEL
jgi:RNA polymerase sigma-70 factor (ECF subfamily)